MNIANMLTGYKTYITAAGILGYAIWQLTIGNYEEAVKAFCSVAALVGLRISISGIGSLIKDIKAILSGIQAGLGQAVTGTMGDNGSNAAKKLSNQ